MQTAEIFDRCSVINDILNSNDKTRARGEIIKLLSEIDGNFELYTPLLNHLIREVGLYPYLNPGTANWDDRFAFEAFKADIGESKPCTLHIEQSLVLRKLLKGESVAVSAPTSFGKSFIVDAFIAIKRPSTVVLIVPTVALADESRRRLSRKFSSQYKIVTTTDATIQDNTILVFPQERAFAYIDVLDSIDILIVDEFYKASSRFDDSRSGTLLNTMIELGKKAKQKYYLAPNIDEIDDNVFTEGMTFLRLDFKTVVTYARHLYRHRPQEVDKEVFKADELRKLCKQHLGKSLVYAGTYNNITVVCGILNSELIEKNSDLLKSFGDWLRINYGQEYELIEYVKKGIGIHNGQLHRSLSQLQIKLFEEPDCLDYIVSTSSIIEGVNTQAENVILWSVKNGSSKIDYFTYRNIVGRAGRMFRYFIGRVFMLEEPPQKEGTTLKLEFPEDVARGLDGTNPGVKLNNQQYLLIKTYQEEMSAILGEATWHQLQMVPQVKAASPSFVKFLASKIKSNANWPRHYSALLKNNTWDWHDALEDVIDAVNIPRKAHVRTYACIACNAWNTTIPNIYKQVSRYGISYGDMFAFERTISFNIATTLSLINHIKQAIYPGTPDISDFIHRASNAFLPKLVFQLEEYGLPRMISRKIQNSGMIDLEDDNKEICTAVDEFNAIGMENLINGVCSLHNFDLYVIEYFYKGIQKNK